MDSDNSVGSDFEVISDDNHSSDTSYDNPILRALNKPLVYSSSDGSSSSEGSTIATVLNSMSSIVPSMEDEVSNRSHSSTDSVTIQNRDFKTATTISLELKTSFDDLQEDYYVSEDECDDILKQQEETKVILKGAIDKIGEFKEEKESMLERITQLEKTVERLNTKNKNLQKVNENGTIFDRHRREKEAQQNEEIQSEKKVPKEEAPKEEKKTSTSSLEIVLIFSIITVGLCVIGAVAYQAWAADDRMERLHEMIAAERRHTEKLRAELDFLEQRLNASFAHIEKMDKLLNSPLQRDFFRTMDAAETKMARGCFIHLNSTENVCQSLTDLLEKEGHDNVRLKEQLRLMRGMANFFMGVIFFLPMFFYYISKRKN